MRWSYLLILLLHLATIARAERPKIVIFWASLGRGHQTAAEGIEADIKARYPDADVVLKDIREFMDQKDRAAADESYDKITKKFPQLFDLVFRAYIELAKPGSKMNEWFLRNNNPDAVLKYIQDEKANAVISTFNLGTETLINLRQAGHLKDIRIGWQHTDYVDHDYFAAISKFIDMTFVPHKALQESWIRRGVDPQKVMAVGMPLDAKRFTPFTKDEKTAFLTKRGLDPKLKTAVLVGGSAGVGDFKAMVENIAAAATQPLQLVVVCGKNEEQKGKVEAALAGLPKHVKVIPEGFMPQQELIDFFKSSDAVISKPGGLNITEISLAKAPLLLLNVNGGQESFNAKFFKREGMAVVNTDPRKLGTQLMRLLESGRIRKRMERRHSYFRKNFQPQRIADWVVPLAREHARACAAMNALQ